MPTHDRSQYRISKHDPQSFGFVLNDLMTQKGCSAEQLRQHLGNIDIALVNRWRRGDRVPHPSTRHPEKIVEVLHLTRDEEARLLTAHAYSLDERAQKTGRGPIYHQAVGRILNPPPPAPIAPVPMHLPAIITSYPLPPTPAIIQGHEELAKAVIAMLHRAAQQHPKSTETPIYLTFYSPDTALPNDPNVPQWWQQSVREALSQGWNIVHLIPLTPRLDQLVALVESIRSYLPMLGTYTPYYLTQYGTLNLPSGLYSVPNVGTLTLFSVKRTDQIDAALYLTDPSQVNLLRQHAEYLFDSATSLASPLGARYFGASEMAEPVYDALLEAERTLDKKLGGRTLFDRGLSFLTRPSSFYDGSDPDAKHFMQGFSRQLREKRTAWWFQMQQTFEQFVPDKLYRDACPMRTIDKLIATREYGLEAEDLVGEHTVTATPQQVYDHLTNVLRLLKNPNYHLALLDTKEEQRFLPQETTFWEVYPEQLALLEYWFPPDRPPRLPRWLDVLMRQRTIVEAFSLYADWAWNQLSPHNDKEFVTMWLTTHIDILKNAYPDGIKEKN